MIGGARTGLFAGQGWGERSSAVNDGLGIDATPSSFGGAGWETGTASARRSNAADADDYDTVWTTLVDHVEALASHARERQASYADAVDVLSASDPAAEYLYAEAADTGTSNGVFGAAVYSEVSPHELPPYLDVHPTDVGYADTVGARKYSTSGRRRACDRRVTVRRQTNSGTSTKVGPARVDTVEAQPGYSLATSGVGTLSGTISSKKNKKISAGSRVEEATTNTSASPTQESANGAWADGNAPKLKAGPAYAVAIEAQPGYSLAASDTLRVPPLEAWGTVQPHTEYPLHPATSTYNLASLDPYDECGILPTGGANPDYAHDDHVTHVKPIVPPAPDTELADDEYVNPLSPASIGNGTAGAASKDHLYEEVQDVAATNPTYDEIAANPAYDEVAANPAYDEVADGYIWVAGEDPALE